MSNTNTPVEQGSATSASVAEMSLADYRALREGKAPASSAQSAKAADDEAHAGDVDRSGESAQTGSANSTDDEAGGADDAAAGGDKRSAKKGGWQRTIDKLKRENDELKQKLAAPAAGTPAAASAAGSDASSGQPANAQSEFDTPKPKMADFESIEAFTDALTDWKSAKRDFETEQRAARTRAESEAKTLLDGWTSREAEARKVHSDYDEVIEAASDIKLSPAHQRLFLESEVGAEAAYALASDPDELKKFAGLSPLAAGRMLGRIEAGLVKTTSSETTTKVSNAPKPARPVSGGRGTSSSASALDVSKMSAREYRAARESGKLR